MPKKQYAEVNFYENKLKKVMERFEITSYDYNFDRHGCWVEFRYKCNLYRFDHSIENAEAHGVKLIYGSDAFAQVVLALEELARMVSRGIYDLQTWVSGMKYLPPVIEIPAFFKTLGFASVPESEEQIKKRFKDLSKQLHPDTGGCEKDFIALTEASEKCIKYMNTIKK